MGLLRQSNDKKHEILKLLETNDNVMVNGRSLPSYEKYKAMKSFESREKHSKTK